MREQRYTLVVTLVGLAALWAVALTLAGCGGSSQPTPTHVAAEFTDGLAHADLREVCASIAPSVVKTAWTNMHGCEVYWANTLGQASFFGQSFVYRIKAHSEKGFTGKHGKGELASVKASYPAGGRGITIHLVKTSVGWRVNNVS